MSQLPLDFETDETSAGSWRPIHYLGSKFRVMDGLQRLVDEVAPNAVSFCDLFTGSGSVALAMSQKMSVTAVDIQEYSRVICSSLLNQNRIPENIISRIACREIHPSEEFISNCFAPLVEFENCARIEGQRGQLEMLCQLVEHGSTFVAEKSNFSNSSLKIHQSSREVINRMHGLDQALLNAMVASRYYGGVYFSYEQAIWIDIIQSRISRESEDLSDTLTASLLSAVSDVANTVGKHFAQPLRPRRRDGTIKKSICSAMARDRGISIIERFKFWLDRYNNIDRKSHKGSAVRSDFEVFLRNNRDRLDVIYADPPYTRDHYSRFYHVLETIAMRDQPGVSGSNLEENGLFSRGLYRAERHQSPFCIKSQAPIAFDRLISLSRDQNAPLIISYSPNDACSQSRPRVMNIEEIRKIASKYYPNVETRNLAGITHSKLNKRDLNIQKIENAEVVLLCQL